MCSAAELSIAAAVLLAHSLLSEAVIIGDNVSLQISAQVQASDHGILKQEASGKLDTGAVTTAVVITTVSWGGGNGFRGALKCVSL